MIKKPLVFSLLFCSLMLLNSGSVFALQIKSALDNETVTAKVSSLDVTRILVQGDRIKSVKGAKGTYTHQNDEASGEIYIQPTSPYQDRAFTVLIDTEKGRHFTLLLNPVAVPSDTLMIVPKGVGNQEAMRFETTSDYELTLTHLIRDMSNGVQPDGYLVSEVNPKKTYAIGNVATLKLKTVYQGLKYRGEIYELSNTQSFPITLDERQFYKAGTLAITLENKTIAPHAKTRVIRVVSYA